MASLYNKILDDLEGHYPIHNPDFGMFHKIERCAADAYRDKDAQAPALEAAYRAYCLRIDRDGTLGWNGYVEGPAALARWSVAALACLEDHGVETGNPWLRARYNHMLWRLAGNPQHGQTAVNAYIATASKYAALTAEKPVHYAMLIDCVRAAHHASRDLSYGAEDLQLQILQIVSAHETLRTAGRAVQLELMEIIAQDETFPLPAVQIAAELAADLFRRSLSSQSSHIIRQASAIGAQLHARLGNPPEYWRSIVTANAA